jgi:hypothetical protein
MAKRFRGKELRKLPSKSRGTCPNCGATRIKLLYERNVYQNGQNGEVCMVCKRCHRSLRK